jgi:hypothetical protein
MRGCLFTSCYPRLRSGAGRTPFPIFHIKRDTTRARTAILTTGQCGRNLVEDVRVLLEDGLLTCSPSSMGSSVSGASCCRARAGGSIDTGDVEAGASGRVKRPGGRARGNRNPKPRTSISTSWSRFLRRTMPRRTLPTAAAGWSSPRSARRASPSRLSAVLTSGRSVRRPRPSMGCGSISPSSRVSGGPTRHAAASTRGGP